MMKMNRIIAVLLVLLLVTAMVPVASAAGATVEAGQTAVLYFSIPNVYGVDGSFSMDNAGIISGVTYSASGMSGGSAAGGVVYCYGSTEATLTITVSATVSASAQPGDQCTFTLTYETSDQNGDMSSWKSMSQTVTVAASEAEETTPAAGDEPTQPGATEPDSKPSNGGGSGTGTGTGTPIDYTELNRQIGIAEGLKESDYTADSWANMQAALQKAISARKSSNQDTVDAAAAALADAIANLVLIDYSKLEAAIAEGNELAVKDEIGNLWFQLFKAIEEGIALIGSGDQEAVDAATEKILDIIEQLKAAIEAQQKPEEVVKEVVVEKEPEGEYCNIPIHRVWPVLFFVSLAVNILFIILAVVYFSRRKKNQKDDTPLVDYDIGDDA